MRSNGDADKYVNKYQFDFSFWSNDFLGIIMKGTSLET